MFHYDRQARVVLSLVQESGMVITVEPGCYGAAFGGGARFEDNILVDTQGAILLSPC